MSLFLKVTVLNLTLSLFSSFAYSFSNFAASNTQDIFPKLSSFSQSAIPSDLIDLYHKLDFALYKKDLNEIKNIIY